MSEMQGTWWYSSGRGPKPKMPLPIPYNPYLPKAAFPTLDTPGKSEARKEAMSSDLGELGAIGDLADKPGQMEIGPSVNGLMIGVVIST